MTDPKRWLRTIVLAVLLVASLGACQQTPPDGGAGGNGGDGARWDEAVWDEDVWN